MELSLPEAEFPFFLVDAPHFLVVAQRKREVSLLCVCACLLFNFLFVTASSSSKMSWSCRNSVCVCVCVVSFAEHLDISFSRWSSANCLHFFFF